MAKFAEFHVEEAALEWLAELGWSIVAGKDGSPDGSKPLREANSDTILVDRLQTALKQLNRCVPDEAQQDALRKITAAQSASLVEENRRIHKLIVEGVPVEYHDEDGTIRGDRVWLIDFDEPQRNDWLATNQFCVIENDHNRRPDVVLFVNGLPLGVIELKNPGDENATLTGAYNQLQTYKNEIPSLFRANALLVASDGVQARLGSLTANEERFMPWRTTDGREIAPKDRPELEVLVKGVFEHSRFLELLRDFTVFGDAGSGPVKIIAGYHQYHAVKRAIAATLRAMPSLAARRSSAVREEPLQYGLPSAEEHLLGDKRIGVIWHTQGSGKSLLMAFYAGQLIRHSELENPTIVVISDRNDLDDQLFGTFAMCRDLIRQTPTQAESRRDLREKLQRASGGVIFSTIQKFTPVPGEDEFPELTDRRNVIVIADEAHRTQYGFRARMDRESGSVAYGFAKHLRDALPNASFIGFTGTPIEQDDKSTPAVFGGYVDIYDISRAVEDGATVPIYYESRLARIELDDELKVKIDEEIEELTEDEALTEQERLKRKWAAVERLVGAKQRINLVAADLVNHLEARLSALEGKAMAVAMSRRIAVGLYDAIVALRPEWHSNDDKAGAIKVVMTGSASDPPEWQKHIGSQGRRDLIAKRAKSPEDPLKLVIVRDMWLTGFDAPPMHTMYVDKPMRGHGLMQAIARVNRVFRDKPAGLVVDYIGIGQNLKHALRDYSPSDQERVGIDEQQAVRELLRRFDIVQSMLHGFDYSSAIKGSPAQRLSTISAAIEFVLQSQHESAEREETDEAKKLAHRRYQDAVLALSKAFALAAASDAAAGIREEVGFFQTVRAALAKTSYSTGKSPAERDFAVQQLLDQAIASTEIVDILKAAGLQSPDISILSDEFLAEVQQMPRRNLALEALKKLLSDEIRSRSKTNVVESKRFSERLDDAIARYHTNAINTVEVIQELIGLAKDIRQASLRGEEQGLTPEEVAFYDALADNESAVEVLGNEHLKVIAAELLQKLKANVTVDWSHRESARARMRVLVKRILRQHGYPPDLQDAAVQTVLLQAELLSAHWNGQF